MKIKNREASQKEIGRVRLPPGGQRDAGPGDLPAAVDLYRSDARKFLVEEGQIRLPFSSLSGVGESAAVALQEARETGGEYISVDDLQARAGVSSAGDRRPAGDGGIVPAAGEQPDHLVLRGTVSLDKGDFIRYYSSVTKATGRDQWGPAPPLFVRKERNYGDIQQAHAQGAPGTSSLRSAPPSGRPGAGSPRSSPLRGLPRSAHPRAGVFRRVQPPGGGHPPAGDVQVHRQPGQAPGAAAGLHPAHRPDGGLPAAAAAEAPALLLRPDGVPHTARTCPGENDECAQMGIELMGGTGPAGRPGGHRRGGGGRCPPAWRISGWRSATPGSSGPWLTSCPCLRGSGSSCGPPSSPKNYAALSELLDPLEPTPAVEAMRRLPRLFGGQEVLAQAERWCEGDAAQMLEYLQTLYSALGQLGLGDRLMVDLGLVQRNDLLHRHGVLRLCGGPGGRGAPGRPGTTSFVRSSGRPLPAVGFSIDLDAVASLLGGGGARSPGAEGAGLWGRGPGGAGPGAGGRPDPGRHPVRKRPVFHPGGGPRLRPERRAFPKCFGWGEAPQGDPCDERGGTAMKPLRIALTKGRLEKATVELLEDIGLDCRSLRDKGRRLILPVGDGSPGSRAGQGRRRDYLCGARGLRPGGGWGKTPSWSTAAGFFEILDLGLRPVQLRPGGPQGGGLLRRLPGEDHRHQIPQGGPAVFPEPGHGRGDHQDRRLCGASPPCWGLADGIVGHCGDRHHLKGERPGGWWSGWRTCPPGSSSTPPA